MISDYSLTSSDCDDTSSYADTTEDDEEEVFFQLSGGDHQDGTEKQKLVTIKQYAQNVVDFSSQYGSDTSISYTAYNVTGKPSKYPDYGDFPETFAFRTYGPWWKRAPSAGREINSQSNTEYVPPTDDFILAQFEELVYPESITVFETYNPGGIVRIWAYTQAEEWVLLWDVSEVEADFLQPIECNKARQFCPRLKSCPNLTRYIRLEFHTTRLEYFTQIDAILLVGQKTVLNKGDNFKNLKTEKLHPTVDEFAEEELRSSESDSLSSSRSATPTDDTRFTLDQMPYEILFKILSFLDLRSLFRCGSVCRTFHQIVACDSLLYTEVSLKPYWNRASSSTLRSLKKRCAYTKKLDLSWCGMFNAITPSEFKYFLATCGGGLTHLRLDSCKFISNEKCLEAIGEHCFENLRELTLQNYTPQNDDFSGLAHFRNLERLDLSRSTIDTFSLVRVLARNEHLRHLNLAFCSLDVSMDDVAQHISKYNRRLISLDMWKSHSLTSVGLAALAKCTDLEEADFGWCLREEPTPGESLRALVKSCPRLRKLYLAAIRGFTDRDLDAIATHCVNLEQLDLLGCMGISWEMCCRLLNRCKKLQLLDLSFCDNLDELKIALMRDCFDVAIKRSLVDFGPRRGEF
ncbi:F-box/LRR-repeat protein 4-like [Topomyia yanbarensis]|uniref:F-box/LRR-repeat protein 4-like n=1 Tax=Topomyia yanbarensis TaxID=2498891 RepID=UPI00273B07C6|nr:F-box/LRR-repeat protein 4-like [Topomyia yanbarensis]